MTGLAMLCVLALDAMIAELTLSQVLDRLDREIRKLKGDTRQAEESAK